MLNSQHHQQQQQDNQRTSQQIVCGEPPGSVFAISAKTGTTGGGPGGQIRGGRLSDLNKNHENFSLASELEAVVTRINTIAATTTSSDVNIHQRRNQLTEQSHGPGFFSFQELTMALEQQEHNISSPTSTSSPTSSMGFSSVVSNNNNNSSIINNNNINNNNINNKNNNSSNSSVNSLNRISSVSPPTSLHSSNSTLNLGNSGTGSPSAINANEHYLQHQHQQHQHHSLHHHPNIPHHNMTHHHQQNSSSGGSFIFSGSIGGSTGDNSSNNVGGSASSGGGGGVNNIGHGVASPFPGAGFSQHHHYNNNNHQMQHQFQRSLSSTSSSIASPPSTSSQQHHQMYQHQQQQHHHHPHHHHHNNQQLHQMQSQSSVSSTSKSCWCFGGDTTYHFKTLVPAVAAGAIIGKGGETIAALQRDTGARVKMSKSHDFYPGTSERVCLITGSIEAIMTVVEFIMEKIREKPDLTTKLSDIEAKQAQERDKQVKILVPNSTAGMIIGKAGAYIKQIKEESGSYVQISQKPKDITLQERCITIIGEKDNNKTACKMIIAKIVEDPQSGTCLNVSYADINGPVANYNPTGSPYATNQNPITSSTASLNSALGTSVGGAGLLVNGAGVSLSLNLGAPTPSQNPAIASQLLEHIKVAMRGSGYSETVTTEVCAALAVLAKYGVLGVGVGMPHTNGAHSGPVSYLGVSALEQSAAAASAAAASGVFGALGQVNLEQYINQTNAASRASLESATQFDPFRHPGSQAATPITLNNNSFGLAAATTAGAQQALNAQTLGALSKSPTPGDLGAKDTKNVEIPEVIIGAVLGPSGRSLVEIQHVSGANVQISKKGIFATGTRNRIVTISGQPHAIAMANYLINQKITEEESKRARQNTLTNVIQ